MHTSLDPSRPIRSQPGQFDVRAILEDLKPFVDESSYDFVLMYSLQELPGWVHSGRQWNGAPAMNIGQLNRDYGNGSHAGSWVRLRGTPHMNSIDLYDQWELFPGSDGGTLIPIHEIGHYWMVNWSRSSEGPRAWRPGDPIAHLAGATYHWSWNWVDSINGPEDMPGIMYSAPLSYEFNEFDLYAMGLMAYSELSETSHRIYECAPPDYEACDPGDEHDLTVEHLVESLSIEGPDYHQGDGRRIPDLDPEARSINTLFVIIKGEDEKLSDDQASLIRVIGENLPAAWGTATRDRSQMWTGVVPAFRINAGLNDAWFNPLTAGQGFLITTFPNRGEMFVAWFIYDTDRPPENVNALLGEPGHRWLTAQGPYGGDTARLTVYMTEGGVFDSADPAAETDPAGVGSMTVEFADCTAGLVTYEIPSLSLEGEIPIERLALDNLALCEALNGQ